MHLLDFLPVQLVTRNGKNNLLINMARWKSRIYMYICIFFFFYDFVLYLTNNEELRPGQSWNFSRWFVTTNSFFIFLDARPASRYFRSIGYCTHYKELQWNLTLPDTYIFRIKCASGIIGTCRFAGTLAQMSWTDTPAYINIRKYVQVYVLFYGKCVLRHCSKIAESGRPPRGRRRNLAAAT